MHRSRYLILANIELFEQRLKSGSLDAQQARAVADLLATARAGLDEIGADRAIERSPTQEDATERTVAQFHERANRWQASATHEASPEKAAAQLRLSERYEAMAVQHEARDTTP